MVLYRGVYQFYKRVRVTVPDLERVPDFEGVLLLEGVTEGVLLLEGVTEGVMEDVGVKVCVIV